MSNVLSRDEVLAGLENLIEIWEIVDNRSEQIEKCQQFDNLLKGKYDTAYKLISAFERDLYPLLKKSEVLFKKDNNSLVIKIKDNPDQISKSDLKQLNDEISECRKSVLKDIRGDKNHYDKLRETVNKLEGTNYSCADNPIELIQFIKGIKKYISWSEKQDGYLINEAVGTTAETKTNNYIYRIRIWNTEEVKVEKFGANNESKGNPSGKFQYGNEIKLRIQQLTEKARTSEISKDEIKNLGIELFDVLFEKALKLDFINFYDEIKNNKDALLRIELDIDERKLPDIAALPWEFLCAPPDDITGNLWLSTAPKLVLSRWSNRWREAVSIQLQPKEKLRIALVVSAPDPDKSGLGKVSYRKLWKELQELAKEQEERIELLDIVRVATRDAIDEVLKKKPHVLHFIGHGRLHKENRSHIGQICIMHESGNARWVDAGQFAGLVTNSNTGIVVLQACESGASSASKAFVSVASKIVEQNIAVVIAMQYEISNATARCFVREFYKRIAQDDPVGKACQEGRYKISNLFETRDFATPMLFMRVRGGRVFERHS